MCDVDQPRVEASSFKDRNADLRPVETKRCQIDNEEDVISIPHLLGLLLPETYHVHQLERNEAIPRISERNRLNTYLDSQHPIGLQGWDERLSI